MNGASIRGINDLEFGPDGLLFAASTLGNEIVILHPQSGAIIERIYEAQGVKAPVRWYSDPMDRCIGHRYYPVK